MDTNGINTVEFELVPAISTYLGGCLPLDFETGALETANVEAEWSRGIRSGKDVLVQEQAPNEVLVLPRLSQARELDVHGSVILEHTVALAEEGGKATNTNVLSHLKLGNLVELGADNVAVIAAKDAALLLRDTNLLERVVTPFSLVASNSDTSNLCAIVDTCESSEGSPATANVEHGLALLETDLLAHNGHLVILHLLEGLLTGGIRNDTGRVDHAWSQEPCVVVIAAVVVGAHLLVVLGAVVENHIRREGEEDIVEQVPGEVERCPVVAVLHDIKAVTVEVNVAAEVDLEESLHGHLAAAAEPGTVGLLLEGEVVLHWAPWKLDLLIDSGAVGGHDRPKCQKQRNKGDEGEEDGCL